LQGLAIEDVFQVCFRFVFLAALYFQQHGQLCFQACFRFVFSGRFFVFNNVLSFVSALFPVCFLRFSFVFNSSPALFFKNRKFFLSGFAPLRSLCIVFSIR